MKPAGLYLMMKLVALILDLPLPDNVPRLEAVDHNQLWAIRKGVWAVYLKSTRELGQEHETGGVVWNDRDIVEPARILYLPGYEHLIPHELSHHIQQEAGLNPASAKCEKQAYWLQSIYWQLFDYPEGENG